MKRIIRSVSFLCLVASFLFSCIDKTSSEHLLSDESYRLKTIEQFEKRKQWIEKKDSTRLAVFSRPLTMQQTEALQFLYAYMPLNDLADYSGEFFLEQVDFALKARETFPWGKDISDELFLHFVLPCRVNNENLDHARGVFFQELKGRLQGLTAEEAALEVNHWCHEKVSYRGSDSRTSAPLATLRTSWGRCGEESTFTVTAMRSVGIPARQVYTPRWAHQNDNHAWVEVYVDGRWQYLGACEPEAKLNVGWFDVPAKRAMMIHTKAFGQYAGKEETIVSTPLYAELNVLSAYADTASVQVEIEDENGNPIKNARVAFGLYNYAEFYPIATRYTDKQGKTALTTGKGDLCIWASYGGRYAYQVVATDRSEIVKLQIPATVHAPLAKAEVYELNVPVEQNVSLLSPELLRANGIRLAQEDSIRNLYMQTFYSDEQARELAQSLNLAEDEIAQIMHDSYGNYKEIEKFIQLYASHPLMLPMLHSISSKDLRDISCATLEAHLLHTAPSPDLPFKVFTEGILSPRIKNEDLRDWRSALQTGFSYSFKQSARANISFLVDWINAKITIDTLNNYYNCPITPMGVHQLQVADRSSRDIYFVALCRAFDIPARIHPATGSVQYYAEDAWKDISFQATEQKAAKSTLVLTNPAGNEVRPEYYIHYTLQRLVDGEFVTFDYEGDPSMHDFPVTLQLEAGEYSLMTGNRYNDGKVRAKRIFFSLGEGETKQVPIEILPLEARKEVLGTVDMHSKVQMLNGEATDLQTLAQGRGMVLALIDPANEPTRHIMVDIPQVKQEFDQWGGSVVFMIPDDKITQAFDAKSYHNLPVNTAFAVDKDRLLLKRLLKSCGKSDEVLPTIVYITEEGEVIFLAQGYRIGIGENLMKVAKINKK